MRRRHLFEFEDLPWFPRKLRNYVTEFLQTVAEKFNMFGPIVPIINELTEKHGEFSVVDLASGSGGQWRTLIPQLRSKNDNFRLVLTDKFPNSLNPSRVKQAFPDIVTVESQPVDASCVPDHLTGVRTLFLSLHHFKPDLARGILAHAVAANTPIAIFEAQQRNIEHVIRFSFSPIMVLILTPMIRPFSIGRLIFTYIIPIVPLVVLWDGVVSVLRTYTLEEIEKLAAAADVDRQFIWKTKLINHGQQKIQVLTGYPKLQTAEQPASDNADKPRV